MEIQVAVGVGVFSNSKGVGQAQKGGGDKTGE